ncbi:MAG: HEAT repeat domain-containing protein [Micropepsaceae bacterium]
MNRNPLLIAALLATLGMARADDAAPSTPQVWTARYNEMARICEANRDSADCAGAIVSVQADIAEALTTISHMGDRDAARAAVRKFLTVNVPGIQTAAAYALARLGPQPEDSATLVALVNDPVPTLRRAAWGALNASTDPDVALWTARAKGQLVGERFVDDVRPTDAETLGVALPPGSVPVWLEVPAWRNGAQIFTADAAPGDIITYFSGIAGRGSVPLAEAAALFEGDRSAMAQLARYQTAEWYQSPYVIVLDEGVAGDDDKPRRLAVVWYDPLFAKTGFALQWVPASRMPRYGRDPWSGNVEMVKTLDKEGEGDEAQLDTSWIKPDAKDFDTEAFAAARSGDIRAAEIYLELFPEGAYRAEAEALKSRPWMRVTVEDPVEPVEVTIAFANLPADQPIRFDVMSEETMISWQNQSVASAPQPDRPVAAPAGQGTGEVVWKSERMLKPGVYFVRVFYGEDRMNFDGQALARMLPGEDVQAFSSFRVAPRMIDFTLDKPVYGFAEAVRITYKGMPKPYTDNAGSPFFTIVPKGAADKEWGRYIYTKDQLEGTVILEAPSTSGDYEVRALFQEDAIVRGVQEFTVDPARATTPIPTPTPEPTPAPTPVPEDMNVVITLDKPSFAANEPITGRVTGLSGDRDWIAVVPAGAEDGTTGVWVYAEKGATESAFTLPGQPAGSYEIRVRFMDQYRPVKRRIPLEIR